jgi:hypothetical protein
VYNKNDCIRYICKVVRDEIPNTVHNVSNFKTTGFYHTNQYSIRVVTRGSDWLLDEECKVCKYCYWYIIGINGIKYYVKYKHYLVSGYSSRL